MSEEVTKRDEEIARLTARVEGLESALRTISAIRDDIVGRQALNWSAHVYPIVMALEGAGFAGAGFEAAREKAKTQDAQIHERDEEIARLTAENEAWQAKSKDQADSLQEYVDTVGAKFRELAEQTEIADSWRRKLEAMGHRAEAAEKRVAELQAELEESMALAAKNGLNALDMLRERDELRAELASCRKVVEAAGPFVASLSGAWSGPET